MKLKKYITLKELEKMNANEDELGLFLDRFGKKALLSELVKFLHDTDNDKWESWLLAENPNLTKSLMRAGANINVTKDRPLRLVATYGDIGMVKILLELGANLDMGNNTALRHAESMGHFELAKFLKKRMNKKK